MKSLFIFASVLLTINALSVHEEWANFKSTHDKNYNNIIEEKLRFQVFQDNLKTINDHNAKYDAGLETYYMGVNKFADMTPKEFSAMLKTQNGPRPQTFTSLHVLNGSAPDAIDWRENGAVVDVKDQGNCGSCWAFSATGAIEGQNFIKNKELVALSEQQLLDCSSAYGNGDCSEGGDMVAAFKYVVDHGLETESVYPYIAKQLECRATETSVVDVKGYKQIANNEEALKDAVGTVGPVSVAIFAEPIQFYFGGIFNSPLCFNFYPFLDHGVLAVGYATEPEPYWIVKNSWGTGWGEKGYFRLARNAGQCGIALDTSYPVL